MVAAKTRSGMVARTRGRRPAAAWSQGQEAAAHRPVARVVFFVKPWEVHDGGRSKNTMLLLK
ncbi:unnamed protein product [Urochloa humidicola]